MGPIFPKILNYKHITSKYVPNVCYTNAMQNNTEPANIETIMKVWE
jgi:hypothetical protein